MDDMDRACGWDKVSDASDSETVDNLCNRLDAINDVVDGLYDENAKLRNRIAELNGPENCATTAAVIKKLQEGLHCALEALVAKGAKIPAIKAYRAATGLGLKDSKDYIEATFPSPPPSKGRQCWDCEYRSYAPNQNPCDRCVRSQGNGVDKFTEIQRPAEEPSCESCRYADYQCDDEPCDSCSWKNRKGF